MALDHVSLSAHLTALSEVEPPLKRAAYSDRTAWMMAVLAELAYDRFEGTGENYVNLAAELARLTNRDEIAKILNECGGNKTEAAKRLGLSLRSLYRRIDKLGL